MRSGISKNSDIYQNEEFDLEKTKKDASAALKNLETTKQITISCLLQDLPDLKNWLKNLEKQYPALLEGAEIIEEENTATIKLFDQATRFRHQSKAKIEMKLIKNFGENIPIKKTAETQGLKIIDVIGQMRKQLEEMTQYGQGGLKNVLSPGARELYLTILKRMGEGEEGRQIMLHLLLTEPYIIYSLQGHPGIPELTGIGLNWWSAKEVKGEDLINFLNKPRKLEEVIDVIINILIIIKYCHQHHVIHRDIKGNNIIYNEDTKQPVLIDFGISHHQDWSEQPYADLKGAPGYMPPEAFPDQIDKPQKKITITDEQNKNIHFVPEIGPFSDIYSFGITWYQIFSGKLPFNIALNPRNMYQSIMKYGKAHKTQIPQNLDTQIAFLKEDNPPSFPPGLKQRISTLIMSCLKKNPVERITASKLIRELQTLKKDFAECLDQKVHPVQMVKESSQNVSFFSQDADLEAQDIMEEPHPEENDEVEGSDKKLQFEKAITQWMKNEEIDKSEWEKIYQIVVNYCGYKIHDFPVDKTDRNFKKQVKKTDITIGIVQKAVQKQKNIYETLKRKEMTLKKAMNIWIGEQDIKIKKGTQDKVICEIARILIGTQDEFPEDDVNDEQVREILKNHQISLFNLRNMLKNEWWKYFIRDYIEE